MLLGEGFWKGRMSACGQQPPPWAGQLNFRVVSMGPATAGKSPVLVLLGGRRETFFRNDVWRSTDLGATWDLVSPHEEGHSLNDGHVRRTKWAGREGFSAAAGWIQEHGRLRGLIYVIAGRGPRLPYKDVWVSQDVGKTFIRMCEEAPFSRRTNAGLAVCPGEPQRLILAGGDLYVENTEARAGIRPSFDCWLSMNAGEHWFQVETPESKIVRGLPALQFTEPDKLLVLGGLMLGGLNFRVPSVDAHHVEVDWLDGSTCWHPVDVRVTDTSAQRSLPIEELSMESRPMWLGHCTAFDLQNKEVVAPVLGGRIAIAKFFPESSQRGGRAVMDVVLETAKLPVYRSERRFLPALHMALGADALQLFLFSEDGAFRMNGMPLQLLVLEQLGRQFVQQHSLMPELWHNVLVALLGRSAWARRKKRERSRA